MEHVTQDAYNPHAFITLRKINSESNDSMYQMYKTTELEDVFNRINYLEQHLEQSNKQLGQIIDNLTMDGWYSETVDKADVLKDLCEIVGHTPTQTLNWTVTLTVSGTSEVNLDEVSDFDVRYHLADNLSVDSNDFTTDVDSWDIDYVDSQDWQ